MSPIESFYIALVADMDRAEVGLWCDACQLPSMVRFPVLALDDNGVSRCGDYEMCVNCDGDEGEDDDGDSLAGD